MPNPDVRLFWELADPMLAAGEATRGTMMGHPCLRAGGAFFATAGHDGDRDLWQRLLREAHAFVTH